MFNIFSEQFTNKTLLSEILDQSLFDEKFVIDIENDYINSVHHVKNKFFIPKLSGKFSELLAYSNSHLILDTGSNHNLTPEKLVHILNKEDSKGVLSCECRQRLIDGNYRWVRQIYIAGEYNGVPQGKIYAYIFDIQNKKDRQTGKASVENRINERNQLTGLRLGHGFIPAAKELSEKTKGPWCCVAIDIQHFEIFNSWMGSEKGDYVLSHIGALLQEYESNGYSVAAYFEHDNFALFTRHNEESIRELFESIQEIIYSYSNTVGFLPAFGVYILDKEETVNSGIYNKAQMVLDEAKSGYTNRIRYFEQEKFIQTQKDYQLLTEFQQAIKNCSIQFYLQPQCNINTGKIIGAEALARWIKDDSTVIIPGQFIPFLEEHGFISDLDKYIWESVCKWIRKIMDKGISPVPVSINVSQIDLLAMDVAAYLYGLTERYNIPAKYIEIELTESAFASDFNTISEAVSKMKEKGFSVLLDDFGSGYSSLNMLDKINTDVIKLDMSFINKDSKLTKKNVSIIESIINMSKTLRIPIIVEGVETEDQVNFLKTLGCMFAQGYYYYRPMPAEYFEKMLETPSSFDRSGIKTRVTELFHTREFLDESIFPDAVLNNILGPVAFYFQDNNGGMSITKYNKPFFDCIADANMDGRTSVIQNYITPDDLPQFNKMITDACEDHLRGGECTVRFSKSSGGEFWYNMHLYFLNQNSQGKVFYGKISDANRMFNQANAFYTTLRANAASAMRIDLDKEIFYEMAPGRSFNDSTRGIDVKKCLQLTIEAHIPDEDDRIRFTEFFNTKRLVQSHKSGIYNENLTINFIFKGRCVKTRFEAYYIKFMPDQNDNVYIFTYPEE